MANKLTDFSYFSALLNSDDDDYEPKSFEPSKPTDKWAGEDEDDDDVKVGFLHFPRFCDSWVNFNIMVKFFPQDNWDDDDEEETDKREVKKETSASGMLMYIT